MKWCIKFNSNKHTLKHGVLEDSIFCQKLANALGQKPCTVGNTGCIFGEKPSASTSGVRNYQEGGVGDVLES